MTSRPCPGNCNSRWNKAVEAHARALDAYNPLDSSMSRPDEPDEDLIRVWGAPVWCTEHASEIRLKLAQLDDLAGIWSARADGHRDQPVTQRVGGTTVVMSQSDIHDQLQELTENLTAWEMAYRDLMGWGSPPPRGDLASVQTSCINWLLHHLTGILSGDYATGFGKAVLAWQPLAAAGAKAGQRTILLQARCPRHGGCGQRMLTWLEGTDQVECANRDCGQIMTKTAYDELAEREAEEHRRLFHNGRECTCHLRRVS